MSDSTQDDAVAARSRAGAAAVCAFGDTYRATLLSRYGDADAVDRAVEALRSADDPTVALDELDAVLQALGDPRGLYGALRAAPGTTHGAGLAPTSPGESVYLCPTARCSRYWLPETGTTVPRCAVSDVALRRTRL
ncbi:hypothetical protein ACIBJE_28210 [Micromonospora sp. NPDC050187]|uniref:hypothetical protein n=1 Tax=Micromonospora sp. NPDC050187 TaxID=3364277 RepID=UPI0037B6B7FE